MFSGPRKKVSKKLDKLSFQLDQLARVTQNFITTKGIVKDLFKLAKSSKPGEHPKLTRDETRLLNRSKKGLPRIQIRISELQKKVEKLILECQSTKDLGHEDLQRLNHLSERLNKILALDVQTEESLRRKTEKSLRLEEKKENLQNQLPHEIKLDSAKAPAAPSREGPDSPSGLGFDPLASSEKSDSEDPGSPSKEGPDSPSGLNLGASDQKSSSEGPRSFSKEESLSPSKDPYSPSKLGGEPSSPTSRLQLFFPGTQSSPKEKEKKLLLTKKKVKESAEDKVRKVMQSVQTVNDVIAQEKALKSLTALADQIYLLHQITFSNMKIPGPAKPKPKEIVEIARQYKETYAEFAEQLILMEHYDYYVKKSLHPHLLKTLKLADELISGKKEKSESKVSLTILTAASPGTRVVAPKERKGSIPDGDNSKAIADNVPPSPPTTPVQILVGSAAGPGQGLYQAPQTPTGNVPEVDPEPTIEFDEFNDPEVYVL